MADQLDELLKKLDVDYWSKPSIVQKLGHIQVAQKIMAELNEQDLLALVAEIASRDDATETDIEDPLPSHCDFFSRLQALCTEFLIAQFLAGYDGELFDEDERRRRQ